MSEHQILNPELLNMALFRADTKPISTKPVRPNIEELEKAHIVARCKDDEEVAENIHITISALVRYIKWLESKNE